MQGVIFPKDINKLLPKVSLVSLSTIIDIEKMYEIGGSDEV